MVSGSTLPRVDDEDSTVRAPTVQRVDLVINPVSVTLVAAGGGAVERIRLRLGNRSAAIPSTVRSILEFVVVGLSSPGSCNSNMENLLLRNRFLEVPFVGPPQFEVPALGRGLT